MRNTTYQRPLPLSMQASFDNTDDLRKGKPYRFIPCVDMTKAEAQLKSEGEQRAAVELKNFGGDGWMQVGYFGHRHIHMRYDAATFLLGGKTHEQREGWQWWFGSMSQHACSGLKTFAEALAHCLNYLETNQYGCNDGVV